MTAVATNIWKPVSNFYTVAQVMAMATVFAAVILAFQGYGPALAQAAWTGVEDVFFAVLRQRYVIQDFLFS